jgi:LacI family transcriptional regulator, galactose operon repressor
LLLIGETQGDPKVEKRVINGMVDRGVSGFIYASMYTRRVRLSKDLRARPLVLLNCVTSAQGIATVIPDERAAGRAAARELVRLGHRDRIVLVGEQTRSIYAAGERRFGVDEVLDQQGARLAGAIDTLWWPEPAYHSVREYLSTGQRPTAFICLNDRIAVGTYHAAAEFGLVIPRDLSVVSFDDSDLASWLRPGLTSMAIPHFELGRRAVEILLAPDPSAGVQRIPMPVRNRGSIGPPGRKRPIRRQLDGT